MIVKFLHVSGHPLFYSKVSSQASVAEKNWEKKKTLVSFAKGKKGERETPGLLLFLSFFLSGN